MSRRPTTAVSLFCLWSSSSICCTHAFGPIPGPSVPSAYPSPPPHGLDGPVYRGSRALRSSTSPTSTGSSSTTADILWQRFWGYALGDVFPRPAPEAPAPAPTFARPYRPKVTFLDDSAIASSLSTAPTIRWTTTHDSTAYRYHSPSDYAIALAGDKTIGQRSKFLQRLLANEFAQTHVLCAHSPLDTVATSFANDVTSTRAFAAYTIHDGVTTGSDQAWVQIVYLDQAHRDILLHTVSECARQHGVDTVRWTVDRRNQKGLLFSHSVGAQVIDTAGDRHILQLLL